MPKKQNEASAYWNALTQLTEIIKTDYREGGKLPPATEMSMRLGVSRVTYGKALKTVCTHGLAAASQGRGGTVVQPPFMRQTKIGVILGNGGECTIVSEPSILGRIVSLSENSYPVQFIQCSSPKKLYETLLIHNIALLVTLNPSMELISALGEIHETYGYPVIASAFSGYWQEDLCLKAGLTVVQHDLGEETREIVEFLIAKNLKNMMLIDGYFGYVDKALNEHLHRNGLNLPPENCVLNSKFEKEFLKQVRKQRPDVIMTEGALKVYLPLCESLMELPKYRRPAVLIREFRSRLAFLREKFPGIRILGSMVYSNAILGEVVSEMSAAYLKDGIPLENRYIDTFSIQTN